MADQPTCNARSGCWKEKKNRANGNQHTYVTRGWEYFHNRLSDSGWEKIQMLAHTVPTQVFYEVIILTSHAPMVNNRDHLCHNRGGISTVFH